MLHFRFILPALLLTISSGHAFTDETTGGDNARVQNGLGVIYYKGEMVPRDHTEAANWFRKAADQGNATAQYNLGVMYAEGTGVPRDDTESIKWLRKAADQGLTIVQTLLGSMYALGYGVPRDFVTAYMWMSLAATNGDEDRQEFLDLHEKAMTQAQVAEGQKLARDWMATHTK